MLADRLVDQAPDVFVSPRVRQHIRAIGHICAEDYRAFVAEQLDRALSDA